jgi:hypothetical protein
MYVLFTIVIFARRLIYFQKAIKNSATVACNFHLNLAGGQAYC